MEYSLYRFLSRLFAAVGMENERIPLERHSIRFVTVYEVTDDELEAIERKSGDLGFDFNCSLACLTSAASIWVTLKLSPGQPSESRTVITALIPMLFLIGAILGARWYRNRGEVSKIIRKIRARQVGPIGDEKRELRIGELESLPLESAPFVAISTELGMATSADVIVPPKEPESEQK